MHLVEILERAGSPTGRVVVLTGAGISAESGIPTFRGADGYWTVGSRHYHAQEIATEAFFARHPEAVWGWYLYRHGVCRAAQPNAGHLALVDLEEALGDRFLLLTQNVDGLHLGAGSSPERTYQVHGNLHFMRCAGACSPSVVPVPESFGDRPEGEPLADAEAVKLRCPGCGGWMRPHVLWFDETYDERCYRFESALRAAERADMLLVVGTSGATSLPLHVGTIAARRGAAIVDVNPEENPFGELASRLAVGCHVRGPAAQVLPQIVPAMAAAFGARDRGDG